MSAEPRGCHCLCQVNHPELIGICIGQQDTSLSFASELTLRAS
jgi:hypothetical protein